MTKKYNEEFRDVTRYNGSPLTAVSRDVSLAGIECNLKFNCQYAKCSRSSKPVF